MNWIDMSDRDRLFNYAKNYRPSRLKTLLSENSVDSYYFDCENDSVYEPNIMEYDFEQYDKLKKYLVGMFGKAGHQNPDLLATIITTAALKNIPVKAECSDTKLAGTVQKDEVIKKETYESVSQSDAPPTFIYEF